MKNTGSLRVNKIPNQENTNRLIPLIFSTFLITFGWWFQTINLYKQFLLYLKVIVTHDRWRSTSSFLLPVTIVDTATQQPLDCVLLLHNEKPPEVKSKALFCYIAVQVSYHDPHGSHPHSPYHMESKPCMQGKLPLIFCFHQPRMVCVIQLQNSAWSSKSKRTALH